MKRDAASTVPPHDTRDGVEPGVLRRALRATAGVWSLTLLASLMVPAALLALIVPRLDWRRAVTRWLARFWLRASALPLGVTGLEHLPADSCVLVANHASYLDGVVMKAALPPRFSFVIKREAADFPVVGFLLRRIGSEFVDRGSTGGRHRAARRIMQRAEAGHSLVFFPEGTFDAGLRLKRFHVGAFVAAAYGNAPVVPAVIRGARRALPNGAILPRPGRIKVEILEPLSVAACGDSVERLRDETRRRMLERLGEAESA
jgi:1-acyl-sn-glycerol-3-phosphate acyltransferase